MSYMNIGAVLKKLRTHQNISQEKLADGIMNRTTLAYVEQGKQMTSKEKLDLLFNRLGHTAKQFFIHPLTESEFKAFQLRDNFSNQQNYMNKEEMAQLVAEMEALPEFQNGLNKQFLLKAKASLCLKTDDNTQTAQALLDEAIRITLPQFNEEHIQRYLLGIEDIEIISMMAMVKHLTGECEAAIRILERLAGNIRKRYVDPHEKARSLCFVLFNLSNYLGQAGRHEDVLAICNEAIEAGEMNRSVGTLPRLKFNKACCLFHLSGDADEIKNLLYQAYYGSLACGEKCIAAEIKQYAWNVMQIDVTIKNYSLGIVSIGGSI